PNLFVPVVDAAFVGHHSQPPGAVHERDPLEVHGDVMVLERADNGIERRDSGLVESTRQTETGLAGRTLDANREEVRANPHRGPFQGGRSPPTGSGSLGSGSAPRRQASRARGLWGPLGKDSPGRPAGQSADQVSACAEPPTRGA